MMTHSSIARAFMHRPLSRLLILLICSSLITAGLSPAVTFAQSQPAAHIADSLPSLGDPASADLSPAAERKLGERVMREIRRDPDYLADPQLTHYLNRVSSRLTDHLARYAESGSPLAVELFAVRDRTVNAFALPGGFIGIHTGLMITARSESELASVVAHEISHVSQRHIARSLSKQNQLGLAAMAATILGILAASRNPDAAQAVIAFGQGAAVQGQLNFSRDMEREADRVGFSLLADASFSPPAMLSFFERLQTVNRNNDSGSYPYLRSHPLTSERIGDMRSRLGSGSLRPEGVRQPSQQLEDYAEFAMMAGRARVLTESSMEGMRSVGASCAAQARRSDMQGAEKMSAQYCAAYAFAKLRDDAAASAYTSISRQLLDAIKPLPATHPAQLSYSLLTAEAAVIAAADQPQDAQLTPALAQLGPLRAAEPLNRPLALMHAEAALAQRQAAALSSARESLQSWVVLNRQDAAAWALLGRVQSALGDQSAALRASAEGAMLDQQWRNATDMLERARKMPGISYFDASIIDARLREAREKLKDEIDESRLRRSGGGNAPQAS